MALANVITDIANAEVTWDVDGTPIVLTPSMGGVSFKSSQSIVEVKQDGCGDAPIDHVTKGKVCTIEMNLSDMDLTRLLKAVYGSVLSTQEYHVPNKCGNSLALEAKKVLVKPVIDKVASTDDSSWITIPRCSPPIESLELGFDDENQKLWVCTMYPYPLEATGFVNVLWYLGVNP